MNIFSGIFLWPDVLCGPASATWIQIPTGQPCVPLVQDGGLAHSRCSISLADYLLPNLILVIQSTIDLENIYWGACLPSTWPSKRGHLFIFFYFIFYFFLIYFFLFVVDFVIHWNETAKGLHVFPIPIPPPTSLSTRSLWVFPVHQVRALVSCIQPGLVICFTLDNIHKTRSFRDPWTICEPNKHPRWKVYKLICRRNRRWSPPFPPIRVALHRPPCCKESPSIWSPDCRLESPLFLTSQRRDSCKAWGLLLLIF